MEGWKEFNVMDLCRYLYFLPRGIAATCGMHRSLSKKNNMLILLILYEIAELLPVKKGGPNHESEGIRGECFHTKRGPACLPGQGGDKCPVGFSTLFCRAWVSGLHI